MPDALRTIMPLILENGDVWGEVAAPWQLDDARAILDTGRGPRLHFLTRPRGGSKTSDLALAAIAVLLEQAPTGSLSLAAAADLDQARLLIDALRGFVDRNDLHGALRVESKRVIHTKSGAMLELLPADAASAWGPRAYFVIVDELAQWSSTSNARGVWSAIISGLPKVADSRLVVLTSAGDPAHWSYKILKRAYSSPRWRVSEIPGPAPWISEDDLEEQRGLLTESQYARLHLNRWTSAEDRLVRPEDLAACVTLDGPLERQPGVTYRIGVDLGLRHDRTVVSVCHAEDVTTEGRSARRVVLDRLHVLAGTRANEVQLSTIEELVVQASRAYGGAAVRMDPWQAVGLEQQLRSRSIRVEEYTFSPASVARLAQTLHMLLRDRLMALPDDPDLLDELENVRLRETSPGVLRMDHDAGRHDDRAIALALAALWLIEERAGEARVASAKELPPTSKLDGLRRRKLPALGGRRFVQ